MIKYNFDEVIDRRGTHAVKLDGMQEIWGRTDLIPLWVADMDFAWTVGFDPNLYTSPSSPWINAKWSAQMPNMNQTYNAIYLNQIKNRSAQSKNDGMGAIAGYDMRVHTERDPLPALQKIGEGVLAIR